MTTFINQACDKRQYDLMYWQDFAIHQLTKVYDPMRAFTKIARSITATLCVGLGCAGVLLATAASAQVAKKSAPASMPDMLTSLSIHTTAPTSIITNEPLLRDPTFGGLGNLGENDGRDSKTAPFSCKNDSAVVCYDYRRGQSVIPLTRSLMPDVPGLKKEGLSVKRDKVMVRYSF
jgi:hypothetical protein